MLSGNFVWIFFGFRLSKTFCIYDKTRKKVVNASASYTYLIYLDLDNRWPYNILFIV